MANLRHVAAALALMSSLAAYAGGVWEKTYDDAVEKAKAEGKFILVDFSGSNWCGWCIRLDNEVFSKSDFKKYARENLVCYVADFPRGKELPRKVAATNNELKNRFGITGFPTVILMTPDGEKVARTGYKKGGAGAYVEHLQALLEPHKDKLPKPGAYPKGKQSKTGRPGTGFRTWRDNRGRALEARLEGVEGTKAIFTTREGKRVKINIANLSRGDQALVKKFTGSDDG